MRKDFNYIGSKKKEYFEGWYFKHTSDKFSFACIPGICDDHAFIQIITNKESFYFKYAKSDFKYVNNIIYIKNNSFSVDKIVLNIFEEEYSVSCDIDYTNHIYSNENIMGPFKNNECKHYVIALLMKVDGYIKIQNENHVFENDIGYIEKDLGTSFPEKWMWLQANDSNSSVMLAIAKMKYLNINIKGIIAIIYFNGKEYKFATYKLARIKELIKNGDNIYIKIKQGKYTLEINTKLESSYSLSSPKNGKMEGRVLESLRSRVKILIKQKDKILYTKEYNNAGAEYNM